MSLHLINLTEELYRKLTRSGTSDLRYSLARKTWGHFIEQRNPPNHRLAHLMLNVLIEENIDDASYKAEEERKTAIHNVDSDYRELLADLPYLGKEYDDYLFKKGIIFACGRYFRDKKMQVSSDVTFCKAKADVPERYQPLLSACLYNYLITGERNTPRAAIVTKTLLPYIAIQLMANPEKQKALKNALDEANPDKSKRWAESISVLETLSPPLGISLKEDGLVYLTKDREPVTAFQKREIYIPPLAHPQTDNAAWSPTIRPIPLPPKISATKPAPQELSLKEKVFRLAEDDVITPKEGRLYLEYNAANGQRPMTTAELSQEFEMATWKVSIALAKVRAAVMKNYPDTKP